MANSPTIEHSTALIEIAKIANYRFDDLVADANPIATARTLRYQEAYRMARRPVFGRGDGASADRARTGQSGVWSADVRFRHARRSLAAENAAGHIGYTIYRDDAADPPILVCVVGKTTTYQARCLDDLQAMLVAAGDWVPLGGADEQKPAAPGTVEAWGRSPDNPVGGWYGLKKGLRGRFGSTSRR